jgi:mono/diheme cytochrome c family protein
VTRPILAAAVTLCAAAALVLTARVGAHERSAAQIAHGKGLYDSHCASCHGMKLEGQPDWKSPLPNGRLPAPPHDATGHSWHHADRILTGITKFGMKPFVDERYDSDMPAFAAQLNDSEIAAIWAYIKSTWPERQRSYQMLMTRQDGQ